MQACAYWGEHLTKKTTSKGTKRKLDWRKCDHTGYDHAGKNVRVVQTMHSTRLADTGENHEDITGLMVQCKKCLVSWSFSHYSYRYDPQEATT